MAKAIKFFLIYSLLLLAMTNTAGAQGKKLAIAFLIDSTGSYDLQRQALALGQRIISGLGPGDSFLARRITAASYGTNNHLFWFRLPSAPPKPQNRFDLRRWQAYEVARRKIVSVKRQAIQRLGEVKPQKAPRTDIWGGIAAAAERLRRLDDGQTTLTLFLCTDLGENVGVSIRPSLKSVQVYVVVWDAGSNPIKARKQKKYWRKELLEKCGAASVDFFHPDEQIVLSRR